MFVEEHNTSRKTSHSVTLRSMSVSKWERCVYSRTSRQQLVVRRFSRHLFRIRVASDGTLVRWRTHWTRAFRSHHMGLRREHIRVAGISWWNRARSGKWRWMKKESQKLGMTSVLVMCSTWNHYVSCRNAQRNNYTQWRNALIVPWRKTAKSKKSSSSRESN